MTDYTYKATTEPGEGFSLGSEVKLRKGFVGVVRRSDGVEVWRSALYVGGGDADRKAAQLQANREAPKWRAYLAQKGQCYHDVVKAQRQAVKDYKAARLAVVEPLRAALSAGVTAAAEGKGADACPHLGDDKLALRQAWLAGLNAATAAGLKKPEGA